MKEAETVCRILAQLTRLLRLDPSSLNAHGASLKTVCQQQNIKCPTLAKAVVSLYLQVFDTRACTYAHVYMRC